MEYKGSTVVIPPKDQHCYPVLRADFTFSFETASGVLYNGVRDFERSTALKMLSQQVIRQIPGVSLPRAGDYSIEVPIGRLFNKAEAIKQLQQIISKIVGYETWYVDSRHSSKFIVEFSRRLCLGDELDVHATGRERAKAQLTPFGKSVATALREVTSAEIEFNPSYAFFNPSEEELQTVFARLEELITPLLGRSGHTIKWLDPSKDDDEYTLDTTPSR